MSQKLKMKARKNIKQYKAEASDFCVSYMDPPALISKFI